MCHYLRLRSNCISNNPTEMRQTLKPLNVETTLIIYTLCRLTLKGSKLVWSIIRMHILVKAAKCIHVEVVRGPVGVEREGLRNVDDYLPLPPLLRKNYGRSELANWPVWPVSVAGNIVGRYCTQPLSWIGNCLARIHESTQWSFFSGPVMVWFGSEFVAPLGIMKCLHAEIWETTQTSQLLSLL